MAKLLNLIEAPTLRGKGTLESHHRSVMQYFTPDGTLMAESDPCLFEVLNEVITEITRSAEPSELAGFNTVLRKWKAQLEDILPQRF